jgi:hypothetical protein
MAAVATAGAAAEQRYADPDGTGTACTQPSPCSLEQALTAPPSGTEVIIQTGSHSYDVGATFVSVPTGVDAHGPAGQPRPTITGSFGSGVVDLAGGTLRNVDVTGSTGSAIVLDGSGSTIDGVVATTTAGGGSGCAATGSALIRNTVCQASGVNTSGIGENCNGCAVDLELRNVTATGVSAGISIEMNASGSTTVNATNVIAQSSGSGFGVADVHAGASGATTVTINLDHSNYDSEFELESGVPTGTVTVTDPGTGTNQSALPLLTDTFHQAPGSPTIDAGAADPANGTNDVDGEARSQGAAVDIGADEFTVATPGSGQGSTDNPPIDTHPPITTLAKGPKKRTTKHKAKFQFVSNEPGSSFMCKLDKKPFAACSAPKTVRVKTGKHTFKVEAVDPAGNIDPTPAVYHWKVLPK